MAWGAFFLVVQGFLSLARASREFSASWFSASWFVSTAHRQMSALVSGLSDFLNVSFTALLACRVTTASCSDEELALTHDMSA